MSRQKLRNILRTKRAFKMKYTNFTALIASTFSDVKFFKEKLKIEEVTDLVIVFTFGMKYIEVKVQMLS